jgi:hypothetical protein
MSPMTLTVAVKVAMCPKMMQLFFSLNDLLTPLPPVLTHDNDSRDYITYFLTVDFGRYDTEGDQYIMDLLRCDASDIMTTYPLAVPT